MTLIHVHRRVPFWCLPVNDLNHYKDLRTLLTLINVMIVILYCPLMQCHCWCCHCHLLQMLLIAEHLDVPEEDLTWHLSAAAAPATAPTPASQLYLTK